jgi:excisionase family DNA binding protein
MRGDDPSPATTELLSVAQAAQLAGVSRYTVRGWIANGHLVAVRINGRRYVRAEDLAATQARAHAGEVVPTWRQNRHRAGKRLRTIREAAGLNQIQLAAASGLTHEAISNLETGKRAPYATTVRALAQALGVAPEQFVRATRRAGRAGADMAATGAPGREQSLGTVARPSRGGGGAGPE